MILTRTGVTLILAGSIILFSVSGRAPVGFFERGWGSLSVNETQCYVILVPPVEANLTIGSHRTDESVLVHVKAIAPDGGILFDENVVIPFSIKVHFGRRGMCRVYVTNEGNKEMTIPVGVRFLGGIEGDKLVFGGGLLVTGFVAVLCDLFRRHCATKNVQKSSPEKSIV